MKKLGKFVTFWNAVQGEGKGNLLPRKKVEPPTPVFENMKGGLTGDQLCYTTCSISNMQSVAVIVS